MVSAKIILVVLAIGAFLVAGGGTLLRPAFATAQQDFLSLKTGVTQAVKDIRSKTQAGESGESVG